MCVRRTLARFVRRSLKIVLLFPHFLAALRFSQISSDNGGYVRGLAGLGKGYTL